MTTLKDKIMRAHRAGFGALHVVTRDEEAFYSLMKAPLVERGKFYVWSTASGLWEQGPSSLTRSDASLRDPWEFLLGLRGRITDDRGISTFLLTGLDEILTKEPVLRRALVESVRSARAKGHMLLLVGRADTMHAELADEIGTVWHELPAREQARESLTRMATRYSANVPDVEKVLDAAQGLTATRMADAFGLAIVDAKDRQHPVDPGVVREFKEAEVGKKSFLKIETPRITYEDLIGHDYLKAWLRERRMALSPQARVAGLPSPKGVLFVGPPGTGKSRFVEATASEWGVPWLTLDAGGLYGSYLGESEARLSEAIEIAERMSPCLLLIDEVERGFSSGRGNDGGTQERVLGKLLTWMAAKTAPVFVVMTSNFADRLPAALVRKGRVDETFLLDFPSDDERHAIFSHYLKRAEPHAIQERDLDSLVRWTEAWSPSEIEATVLAARFTAYAQSRQVAMPDIVAEIEKTVPVARSMSEQVTHMRLWATANARRTAYAEPSVVDDRILQA
jgi:AAA+ superfamily predicted ATPase